ncbi:tetratricopeptide repeat protein [Paenibacillus lycopersici]|uniref:Tetratricopeptide repeat protein n=1 Tax=Paenibacillus lycopersici TaxID=2704462 RepID=A0A6C0G6I8_9BACL|nr:tetratricopeptide repeat protein [Paenibacillus lycopersici]QHT61235.1 tetratricopeptide repeat protein [Paenibacillus lycopersici]
MKRERLDKAIQLREEGRAKQNQALLAEVRAMLLDLVSAYPDDAEINYQTAVAHDNSGLGREAIPFYELAIKQGLAGADLERALLGLGSTYRYLGYYKEAEETLRRGVREFPHHRGLQVFLAIALYNTGNYKESTELLLTNLLETTADEKLQYFSKPIKYYAQHLDETWE